MTGSALDDQGNRINVFEVIHVVHSAPTGRWILVGMLSPDCAALHPGLFSTPPYGRKQGFSAACEAHARSGVRRTVQSCYKSEENENDSRKNAHMLSLIMNELLLLKHLKEKKKRIRQIVWKIAPRKPDREALFGVPDRWSMCFSLE
jgi:hypothetical protein